jgi:hypothetical protein
MKNRKREFCTSGSVRDEGGNILIYSAARWGGGAAAGGAGAAADAGDRVSHPDRLDPVLWPCGGASWSSSAPTLDEGGRRGSPCLEDRGVINLIQDRSFL